MPERNTPAFRPPQVYRPEARVAAPRLIGPPVYRPGSFTPPPRATAPIPRTPPVQARRIAPPVPPLPQRHVLQRAALSNARLPSRVIQPTTFEQYNLALEEQGLSSNKIAKRLRAGQDAIIKTRKKLGFGAGNISQQVVKSSGASFVNTGFVKSTGTEYSKQGIGFLEAWAIAARRGSAGNCDEFAAVTYFYLLEMNIADSVSVVGLPDVHHHFVLIGDPANPIADDAVVVDPWPAKGIAVLYKHWEYKGENMKVTVGPTLSKGQTPLKDARQTLKQAGLNRAAFEQGLKEAYDKYGSGKEVKKQVNEVHSKGGYFWGNEHTLKQDIRQNLTTHFQQRRQNVTDPLSLPQEEFEAIFH